MMNKIKNICVVLLLSLASVSGLNAGNAFAGKPLNDENLMECLKHYEVDNPKWVLAQAKLETGNYKSKGCKVDHNLFGLYNSRKGRYMKFSHWAKSVKAYKEMIQREGRYDKEKYNDKNYGQYLKKIGYAEDKNYVAKVKKIKEGL